MALYYVDLDVTSNTGFQENSTSQPMGALEYRMAIDTNNANYGTYSNHSYKMRGQTTYSGVRCVMGINDNYVDAWDLVAYGPWRINFTSNNGDGPLLGGGRATSQGSGHLSNGIINTDGSGARWSFNTIYSGTGFYGIWNNMILRTTGTRVFSFDQFIGAATTLHAYGCTFIGINFLAGGSTSQFTLTDCIFSMTGTISTQYMTASSSLQFTNCLITNHAFTDFTASSSRIFQTNSAFSHPGPVGGWPSWNATKESWAYSTLFVGANIIPTPPGVGNPPYTGFFIPYNVDLWGSNRSAIGAGNQYVQYKVNYFSSSSVADGVSVTSICDAASIVNKIQTKATDTYFDDTNKISYVDVHYLHVDGRQKKVVRFVAPLFEQSMSWTSDTKDGLWQKVRVKIVDTDGAEAFLYRDDIGVGEDLTHGSGSMLLNT